MGGHLRAGESLRDGVREAEEEIGLAVALDDLMRLGRRFAAGGRDNEVQEVLAVRSDLPLAGYRLHPEEVDAVVAVPLEAAVALFEGRLATVLAVELRRCAARASEIPVTAAGFAGSDMDGYNVRALRGLAEVIAGRVPSPFELR